MHDRETHREIREKVTGKLLTLDRAPEPILPALLASSMCPSRTPTGRRSIPLSAASVPSMPSAAPAREARATVFVVFEDPHWIDAETQALLDGLVESAHARLLPLVNYRPEYQHGWGRKTYYSQLRLDALPPEARASS